MTRGGETKFKTQIIGDEGIVFHRSREKAFTDREHDDIFEVEATRLQHAHNLESSCRFPMKRNRQGGDGLPYQSEERCTFQVEPTFTDEAAETVERSVDQEEGFCVECALKGCFSLSLLRRHFMQQIHGFFQPADIGFCTVGGLLHAFLENLMSYSVSHRVTFCDVCFFDQWGYGMQYWLNKRLVAQHHCRLLLIGAQILLQPGGKRMHLSVFR